MQKTFTTGLVLGVVIILTALLAYLSITTARTVAQDHAVLSQIVDLINKSAKQTPAVK